MKITNTNRSHLIQSKRTNNYNRSHQQQHQHQHKHLQTQQKYLQTSTRSLNKNRNYYHQQQQSHISYNNNNSVMNDNNRIQYNNQLNQSIEQIIDSLKLYIKSAHDLKKYLHMPRKQNHTLQIEQNQQLYSDFAQNMKSPMMLTNTNINKSRVRNQQSKIKNNNKFTQLQSTSTSSSQQLILITTKLNMFITTAQSQLLKLHNTIQRSSLNQLSSICKNYNHILSYTKQKYSQLLKQTYRMLNIQSLLSQNHQLLTQQDLLIVKQNKKRKLEQIKQIQRQLQQVWNYNKSGRNRENIITNIVRNDEQKQNNLYNQGQQSLQSSQNRMQSILIKFDPSTSSNPRMLQMLIPPISKSNKKNNFQQQQQQPLKQLNLRKLAREQLQKQFLQIRINAYNMYQRYISHQHKQHKQRLQFVKQEQQILESQLNQQIQLSQQIAQEYHRLRREVDQIKTINQLIKKRYVLRESMRIDSESSLYHHNQ